MAPNARKERKVEMRVKTLLIAVGLVLLMAAAALGNPVKDRVRFKQKLNLSDQQAEQLKELNFNTAKELIQMKADLKTAQLEMKRMIAERNPDKEALFRKLDEISRIQAEMKKVHLEKKLALREILTEEQLDKVREMKQRQFQPHQFKMKHRPQLKRMAC